MPSKVSKDIESCKVGEPLLQPFRAPPSHSTAAEIISVGICAACGVETISENPGRQA
ncbi:MAG: hypothetical protein M3O06_11180 [Pseudomonadota bacterium]|nr:hypothetical protein [Pseudomonadota bacterium]